MSHADRSIAALAASPDPRQLHFLIGQDRLGRWVAIETHGLAGGLFRSRRDALSYTRGETRGQPHAVDLSGEGVEFRV